ncbi:exported hypothetical protein [Candidatus Zixiibacteriota bacterium]|nr:exported hypothetical protein [candidate division Zixibacteria bacterium]
MSVKMLKVPVILIWLMFLVIISKVVHSADQDFFSIYNLEVEGTIYDYVSGDFNGDGWTDIAMIYSPYNDPNSRYIGLHLQKGPAGFSGKADYLVSLPPTVTQIDVADIDGDGQAEILAIDGDGVLSLKYAAASGFAAPNRIVRQNTIYAVPMFQGIIAQPFAFELADSPGPELAVPTARGLALFEKGSDGRYQILNQLNVSFACRNMVREIDDFSGRNESGFRLSLPKIVVADGNLDGRKDLYMLWDRRLCYFFQDSSGNFAQTPDDEISFQPAVADGYLQSRLADLNGDGRPDAVVSYTSGGITKTETKLRFYYADGSGRINAVPRKEISLSDSHCNLIIGDLTQNRRQEVVVPAVELGAIAATKMLLMKKTSLHLLIYTLRDGVPDDEPVQRTGLEFRINFDEPVPTREVMVDWSADFNGDGPLDLVFSDGSGRLQFYWGRSDSYLSRKPDLEVPLEHPSEIHPVHLNKGKFSDLIVEHNLSGRIDRLTVLKNKNNQL